MKSRKNNQKERPRNKIEPKKRERILSHVKQLITLISLQLTVTRNLEREIDND